MAVVSGYLSYPPFTIDDNFWLIAYYRGQGAVVTPNSTTTQKYPVLSDGTVYYVNGQPVTIGGAGSGAINDTAASTSSTYSSSKTVALLAGKADLVSGTVPRSQLPNLSGSFWQTVANQAAMLALTAPDADTLLVVFRVDQPGYIWFLNPGLNPATLGNWQSVQEDAAGAAAAAQAAAIAAAATDATSKVTAETTRAQGAEATKRTKPTLLATATVATALTKDAIQPLNPAAALTNTALPALSGASVGDTYWLRNLSNYVITQPLSGSDTTSDGATTITSSMPGTLEIACVANPAGGGNYWTVVNHVRADLYVQPRGLPVGITGAASFDPARSIYGASRNLRKLRAKLAQALAGAGLLDVLCVGPSTTEGYTTAIATQSYPAYLRQRLAARGYTAATGWVFCQYNTASGTDDARWTFTNFTKYTAFKSMLTGSNSGGGTAVFASTEAGTVAEFQVASTFPAFSYAIDGGTATNVAAGGTAAGHQTFTVTGLSSGTHTITITTSAAGLYLLAARVRPTAGVLVSNCGFGGSKSSDWDLTQLASQNFALPKSSVFGSTPDLVIIDANMAINDYVNSVSVATFQANFGNIVSQYQAQGCDVILLLPNSPSATVQYQSYPLISDATYQTYRQAVYAVADKTGTPLVDVPDRTGLWAVTNANGLMADAYHGTPAGNATVAQAVDTLLAA